MSGLVIVLIIAHNENLSLCEKESLSQCFKILHKYPIKLICPEALNISEYKKVIPNIVVEFIEPKWQSSYRMFNRLKIDSLLYTKFKSYNYILFYELDAWVFRDELAYWCNKGYDYIGAPWSGMHEYDNELLVGIGNGGFSLRKINGALKMLRKLRMLEVLEQYQYFNWRGIVPRLPCILIKLFKSIQKPGIFEKTYNFQEDVFWCKSAPKRLNNFTCKATMLSLMGRLLIKNESIIAPVETAVKFSIETNPKELYKLNNGQLPFGCHAWEKYDPEFWKAFIPFN